MGTKSPNLRSSWTYKAFDDCHHLGYNAMYSNKTLPSFQRTLFPLSSGSSETSIYFCRTPQRYIPQNSILYSYCCDEGSSIAQAVSRRLPTAAARVRSKFRSCGISGGLSGTGAGFLRVLRFPLPILIPPTAPHSSSIIRGWYNRSDCGRRTKWTQCHPTTRNKKKNYRYDDFRSSIEEFCFVRLPIQNLSYRHKCFRQYLRCHYILAVGPRDFPDRDRSLLLFIYASVSIVRWSIKTNTFFSWGIFSYILDPRFLRWRLDLFYRPDDVNTLTTHSCECERQRS
jgi:hypothetical protein